MNLCIEENEIKGLEKNHKKQRLYFVCHNNQRKRFPKKPFSKCRNETQKV